MYKEWKKFIRIKNISYVGEICWLEIYEKEANPMDTVESSNQYVSGMTVKNSHRVSLYNNR